MSVLRAPVRRTNHRIPMTSALFLLTLVFPLLVTVYLVGASPAVYAQQSEPPRVTIARPVAKKVTEWDEYTGRFVAKQRVEVRARVSGYLDSVHFEEGQHVDAGQLLFVIDPRPLEAAVARAAAELEQARTTLKVARLEFERGERLESSRAMSRENMEERRAARDAAQAVVNAAAANLRAARLDLSFTQVRARSWGRAPE